jgi:hypothetical protein
VLVNLDPQPAHPAHHSANLPTLLVASSLNLNNPSIYAALHAEGVDDNAYATARAWQTGYQNAMRSETSAQASAPAAQPGPAWPQTAYNPSTFSGPSDSPAADNPYASFASVHPAGQGQGSTSPGRPGSYQPLSQNSNIVQKTPGQKR